MVRFFLTTLMLFSFLTKGVGAEPVFRAGAFAQDITPTQFPISVNGGMSDVKATGFHDRLHARCLVLDDGKTRLAFAVCDSCMIPREVFDLAKKSPPPLPESPPPKCFFPPPIPIRPLRRPVFFKVSRTTTTPLFWRGKLPRGSSPPTNDLPPPKLVGRSGPTLNRSSIGAGS